MFLSVGIRSVSMDDIARELGHSKKTLYVHFPTKLKLVDRIMQHHLDRERSSIQSLRAKAANAIDEWLLIFEHNCRFISTMHPSVIHDLQKYYPKAWSRFKEYKQEFIRHVVMENMDRGRNEGLYRADADPDIISKVYIHRLEMFADNRLFPESKYSKATVYATYSMYHLRGLVSMKGLDYLE